jgi:hypothetical protein
VKREAQVSWRMVRSTISNMELFAVRTPASKGVAFSKVLFLLVQRGRREYPTLFAMVVGPSFLICTRAWAVMDLCLKRHLLHFSCLISRNRTSPSQDSQLNSDILLHFSSGMTENINSILRRY